MTLYLREDFDMAWKPFDPFEYIETLDGEIFRQLEARKTLRFEQQGKSYFIKIHRGVGWWEIIENLLRIRLPVLGAQNEWRAIHKLESLGVDTMNAVAYGSRGVNPARQKSFIVTEDLSQTISLEDFCRDWPQNPPSFALKKALIEKLAEISRTLHDNGVNHRDYYLCHFLLDISGGVENLDPNNLKVSLIDLHRAQIRKKTPLRWRIKDLAGLCFSALEVGLTKRDVLRFLQCYYYGDIKAAVKTNERMWAQIEAKVGRLYARDQRQKLISTFVRVEKARQRILQVYQNDTAPFLDIAQRWRKLLERQGYEVTTIFLAGRPNVYAQEKVGGFNVAYLGFRSSDLKGFARAVKSDLKKICINAQFDALLAHRYKSAAICCAVPSIQVVAFEHGMTDYRKFTHRLAVLRAKERVRFAGVSNAVCAELNRLFNDKQQQLAVCKVYNLLDFDELQSELIPRDKVRSMLGVDGEDFCYVSIGRLHPGKDHVSLIKSFHKVSQLRQKCKLFIVGGGSEMDALNKLVHSLGLNNKVVFLGHISEAKYYLKGFDCLVHTSTNEAFGMVLLESMIAGVPIIYTEVGGTYEVVGESGLHAKPGDVDAIAGHMKSIINLTPEQKSSMSEAMREKAKSQFSEEAIAKSFMLATQDILN